MNKMSSISGLMLVVLTIAVGFAAMMSQSDFLKGCLVTLVAGWIVRSFVDAIDGSGRRRASSIAFLVAASVSLFAVFGPWSDAKVRDELFKTDTSQAYLKRRDSLWPTTRAFLRLIYRLQPRERGWIVAKDEAGRSMAEIVVTADRGDSGMVIDVIDVLLKASPGGSGEILTSRNDQSLVSPPFVLTCRRTTYDNSLQACYILASLGAGGLARCCVRAFRWTDRDVLA